MKLFKDKKHVNIPVKFQPIKEEARKIISFDKKRLSSDERQKLEAALLDHLFQIFLSELKTTNKAAYDYLTEKGDTVNELQKVFRRDGSIEFRIVYKNGIQARCLRKSFPASPYTVKYYW